MEARVRQRKEKEERGFNTFGGRRGRNVQEYQVSNNELKQASATIDITFLVALHYK